MTAGSVIGGPIERRKDSGHGGTAGHGVWTLESPFEASV